MKAIVMGRNYTSTLSMIRCAGEKGLDVTAIRTVRSLPGKSLKSLLSTPPVESKSRYVTAFFYAIEPDPEALVRLLLDKCAVDGEKAILLPTDDYTMSTVDLNQDRLRERFLFPNVRQTQGGVVRLMDKAAQKAWARAAGLDVVRSWNIDLADGAYQWPEDLAFPLFVKPRVSYLGRKGQIRRCETPEELTKLCDRMEKASLCPLLAEEYVHIEKEYGVVGFSDGEQVVTPVLIEKIAIGSGHHLGVTLLGRVTPLDGRPELRDRIHALIRGARFTGLFDIDLFEANGVMYFNELNLRMGAFGYAARCAGVNLPGMLIDQLTGRPVERPGKVRDPFICISEKVNLDEYQSGYIDYPTMKGNLEMADDAFLRSDADPAPYRVYRTMLTRARIKRALKPGRR